MNVGKLGELNVSISHHALARMVEMDVLPHQVELTLTAPDQVYASVKYPGDVCYRRDWLALATRRDGDTLIVKTALYARLKDWKAAAEADGLGDGRDLRTDTGIPS